MLTFSIASHSSSSSSPRVCLSLNSGLLRTHVCAYRYTHWLLLTLYRTHNDFFTTLHPIWWCVKTTHSSDTRTTCTLTEVPEKIARLQIVNITESSVKLVWEEPYSSDLDVKYLATISDPLTNESLATAPSAEPFVLIENLKPDKEYTVSVVAENEMGLSEPSEPIVFKTDESAPSGPPMAVSAIPTGPNSIKISWKVCDYVNVTMCVLFLLYSIRGSLFVLVASFSFQWIRSCVTSILLLRTVRESWETTHEQFGVFLYETEEERKVLKCALHSEQLYVSSHVRGIGSLT